MAELSKYYSDFICCKYCRDLKNVAKFILKKMQMLQSFQICEVYKIWRLAGLTVLKI